MAWLRLQIPSIPDPGTPGAPGEIGVSLGPLVNQSWGDHLAPSGLSFSRGQNSCACTSTADSEAVFKNMCLYIYGPLTICRKRGRMDVIRERFGVSADRWMCFVPLPSSLHLGFAPALVPAFAFFFALSFGFFSAFVMFGFSCSSHVLFGFSAFSCGFRSHLSSVLFGVSCPT